MVPPISLIPAICTQMLVIAILPTDYMMEWANWHFLIYTILVIIIFVRMCKCKPKSMEEMENSFEKCKIQLQIGLSVLIFCGLLQHFASIYKCENGGNLITVYVVFSSYIISMASTICFVIVQSIVLDFEEGYKRKPAVVMISVFLTVINILLRIPLMHDEKGTTFHLMSSIGMGIFCMDLHFLLRNDGIKLGGPERISGRFDTGSGCSSVY